MKKPATIRPLGRPRDRDKALAILDAAWMLFLERGVEATSVEAIAAKAAVSKVTLYTHYSDKAALFEAAVRREMERIEAAQRLPFTGEAIPITERLQTFGNGIMSFLTSTPAIDFYAVVAGELRRHDALALAFYDLGPGRTRSNLAAVLDTAMRNGELGKLDPSAAADELFGLWQGFTNFQFALGIEIGAIRDDIPARVKRGVDVFMRAYGTSARPR